VIKALEKTYDLCRQYLAKAKEAEENADKCSDKSCATLGIRSPTDIFGW
jgi:hypothetical protein